MNLAVLIPFHAARNSGGADRQLIWDYLRPEWERVTTMMGMTLIVGSDPLVVDGRPFSVSRATNNAVAHAPAEVDAFVTFGADHMPDPLVLDYAVSQLGYYAWTRLYTGVSYLGMAQTHALLAGAMKLKDVVWPPRTFAPCPGVYAVHRTRWDAVGGMGEQYEGWGYEDTDMVRRLTAMSDGGAAQAELPLYELWHPNQHRDMTDANPNLVRYRNAWRQL